MRILIFVFLFALIKISNAQQLPQLIPPSPESEEFINQTNFKDPISSGQITRSIPIYNIEVGDYTFPISLTYSTSGIKKGQTSGEVGLGWIFNSGYRITRSIYGFPDEDFDMPENIGQELSNFTSNGLNRDRYLARYLYSDYNSQPWPVSSNSRIDGEYDIFNYSLPNNSGQFVISNRNEREVLILDQTPLKINYDSQSLEGFEILDKKGNIYNFGHQNSTSANVFETGVGGNVTAWALTQIKNKGGDINFEYEKGVSGGYDSHILNFNFYEAQPNSHVNSFYNRDEGQDGSYSTFFLSNINSPLVNVEITRGGANKISTINIKKTNGDLIRRVEFQYNTNVHHYLKKIKFYDSELNFLKEYSFDYYSESLNPLQSSHDQWGFYMNQGFSDQAYNSLFHQEFFDDLIYPNGSEQNGQPLSLLFDEGANRSNLPSTSPADHFSLKTLVYPTGGKEIFYYENNKYKKNNQTVYGGGIRVKEIQKTDKNENILLKKVFKYGINEDGFGAAVALIDPSQFTNERILFQGADHPDEVTPQRAITYSTQFQGDLYKGGFLRNFVNYPRVSVYDDYNALESNGKTIYYFENPSSFTTTNLSPYFQPSKELPFSFAYNQVSPQYVKYYHLWRTPYLQSKEYYKLSSGNQFQLTKKEEYFFTSTSFSVHGLKVRPFALASDYNINISDYYNYVPSFYKYALYELSVGKRLMNRKKIKTFDQNGVITEEELYTYNDLKQLTDISYYNSKNENVQTKYEYPLEQLNSNNDPSGVYAQMLEKNMIDYLVVLESKNNGETQKNKTVFKNFGSNILRNKTLTSKDNENYQERLIFNSYDSSGNLLAFSRPGGMTVVYLWGYNDQYPIAKIENATSSSVSSALGISNLGNVTESHMSLINDLRADLPNAMVTTYTYEPLVGMASLTDARGQTTYYEYDDASRLKAVLDFEQHFLEEYEYHYQTNN
ncbi:MAG: hypothetical protein R3353_00050 [Salegentibacter mishustinae]|nr:hypothetical protein [Salegentibacter mishustinae]